MKLDNMIQAARKLSDPFRVANGKKFRLQDFKPNETLWLKDADKDRAQELLEDSVRALAAMQDKLYAHDRWGLLLIFQAMDAAGKDSAIKHVMSGVNPQGCQVYSFKAPSEDDLDHDFMWRCSRHLPRRGNIGIFNRSYYEEVLVVKVHPELLEKQKLPGPVLTDNIWKHRYADITNFEQYLAHSGIIVRKFFLNVSKQEQKQRFLKRVNNPDKHWKFSAGDLKERALWNRYMQAYEDMVRHTASEAAPWYVVPADHKWFTRIVVASAIIETLASLKVDYPKISATKRKELAAAGRQLARKG